MAKKLKKISKPPRTIALDKLRWRCPEDLFEFRDTSELKGKSKIIGQPRALQAIRTGLEIKNPGYNIFVSGLTGTGRSTTVREILKRLDRRKKVPDDKIFVNNFKDPDQPRLIRLPAGQGRGFRKDMDKLVDQFKRHLPKIYESDQYKKKTEEITENYRSKERDLFQTFEGKVQKEGFTVVRIQMGSFSRPDIMPARDGKPLSFEDLEKEVNENKMKKEELNTLQEKYLELKQELDKVLIEGRGIEQELMKELEKTVREYGTPCIETLIDEIRKKYDCEAMDVYLDDIKEYTLDEINIFLQKDDKQQQQQNPLMQLQATVASRDPFRNYSVNLIVDNSQRTQAPVIVETAPNYKNLFGTIEKIIDRSGNWVSDWMNIKAGTVLRADGGYLVINLLEAIGEPWVWQTLKRTLKYGQLEIESPEALYIFGQSALKPQPVKLDIKVVLIGDKKHQLLLYNYDEDFRKIFKINADFEDQMDRTEKHILDYTKFINKLTDQENIAPFDRSGVAAIIEEAVRMADNQKKLSACFSDVADLIRESGYWATKDKKERVSRKHVNRALKEQICRHSMIEDRMKEFIKDGMIMIDTSGKKHAQINGLAVYDYGEYSFGKPVRISVSVSLGKSGIINIEREAELSGKIHDKGIAILTGFMRNRFAQDKPLAFSASICFEQSYGGIDGDSASSTELYLLLSELAGVEIRQDIAVTGSVNQHGEIQPIGGVNQKIEGFFDVCKHRKLTRRQGVIIPHQNVTDLQLREDVLKAVEKGQFHIWAVKSIDEGIEILTGVKSGQRLPNGNWEPGTINYLANERLKSLALGIQKFYASLEEKTKLPPQRPSKEIEPPPPPKQPTRKEEDEGKPN